MVPPEPTRRLVVNADDFGRSHAINQAVLQAHCEGILTSASLMMGGEAVDEAVALARCHPRLGVGLHLTLANGRAVAEAGALGALVSSEGRLDDWGVRAGWRYFADRRLREPLRWEIRAQLEAFRRTGLEMDHLNGHLHFHVHPVVWDILETELTALGIRRVRVPRDPLVLNFRLARGATVYRLSHAAVFGWLGRRARGRCARLGWRHTERVFGLLQNGRVDEAYVLRLLRLLPRGDSELYSHPSLDEFRNEFEALVSPRVREAIGQRGVQLVRYQDL